MSDGARSRGPGVRGLELGGRQRLQVGARAPHARPVARCVSRRADYNYNPAPPMYYDDFVALTDKAWKACKTSFGCCCLAPRPRAWAGLLVTPVPLLAAP